MIALSVETFICVFVCGHKNEKMNTLGEVAQYMSQKCENIIFYVPHDQE